MRNIDRNAIKAKQDKTYCETFISEYESFILQTAYKATGKYITKSDDQWSISLFAFHEAIQSYSYTKGRFFPFAEMVIKRRLFDYMKKQSKTFCEMPVNPYSFGDDTGEEDIQIQQQIVDKTQTNWSDNARWEIEAISELLKRYGFSFFDLISASPKAGKTKTACAKAIVFLSQNKILLEKMRKSKNLPVKTIEKNINVPKKILERHRKYIIAAVEIITGDYPILSEYLKYIKEESSR